MRVNLHNGRKMKGLFWGIIGFLIGVTMNVVVMQVPLLVECEKNLPRTQQCKLAAIPDVESKKE